LFPDLFRSRLQRLRVAGAQGKAASLGGKYFRRGTANALAGGGNDSYAVLEAGIHEVEIIRVR
jgi:hypothetical protein